MPKVLITTVPFGDKNRSPLDLLEDAGVEYLINPLNKKLTEAELIEMIGDFDVIIAGTEQITTKVMNVASKLKMISRVGIGLDSVDLLDAKEQGITVSYTPDAPAPAELTIGLAHPVTISAIIINTARGGIINEHDLYKIMQAGHLSGAAIDVFDFEPYDGKLREIQRCILTAHMGSMSVDCRTRMEIEATEEAVRFLTNQPLKSVVPEEEYAVQREGL